MKNEQRIEIDIKLYPNGMYFISHYVLPTGDIIFRDPEDPDRVGYGALIPYQGQDAWLNYSDGSRDRLVLLQEVTEDYIEIKDVLLEVGSKEGKVE